MAELKQAIVLREDISISRGKMVAQACHASLGAYKETSDEKKDSWEDQGAKKVVLSSGDKKLGEILREAERNDLPAFIVRDAGMTELEPGTRTAVGIGPAEEDKIDTITGQLKLIE